MVATGALTLARVAHYPLPGANSPAAVRFSPDSRLLTYLWSDDGSLVRALWAFDIETRQTRLLQRPPGEGDTDATVSREEALRRERQRVRGFGITSYAWAEKAPVLLIPVRGELYLAGTDGSTARRLETGGAAIDARLNSDGSAVAYVRDGELWLLETAGGEPRRLTSDATQPGPLGDRTITNGLAEFVAQEEMGRSSGFWWSDDGGSIAFTRVDTSDIPPYVIVTQGGEAVASEVHRYPFAGGANARVRLGVVDIASGDVRWLDYAGESDAYLARLHWTPDGQILAQVQSRDQRRLELRRIDPTTGASVTLWQEVAATWVNLHDDLRFIKSDQDTSEYQILWSSERDGYLHLYLYDREGRELRQLTRGEWAVDSVVGVAGGWVYFLAGRESPLERQLERVALAGGEVERLSAEPGVHSAVLAPSGMLLADGWDAAASPPTLLLRDCSGGVLAMAFANTDNEAERLGLRPPELLTCEADDGTLLYGALYRPTSGAGPWPVLVSVYGGPHAQTVNNSWGMTVDLRAQYLARQGFLVWKFDNRGSARRGHRFEAAIRHNMGDLEVQDQVAGIRFLSHMPEADTTRVGVYGWSYGGYMTLMCLLRAPDVFHAGVAGAPVTHWDGYDTHYTERYMGTPASNAEGYLVSSALAHADQLQGALLLIHGMIDENVHFRHSARLVNALIEAGRTFELLPFPDERHMPRSEADRRYLEERLVEHFARNLRPRA